MSTVKPKYSQSEINLFLKCGRAWEYRYVMGLKTPPKAALTLGKSVDKAVTANFIEKIKTGADLPMAAVLDAYSTAFESERLATEWEDEDPGEQKDMGVKLVKLHHEQAAPSIVPVTVQEEFVIETDAGYDLGGTFDVTDSAGRIRDTKTANKSYSGEELGGVQPLLYDFAYEAIHGKPATGFVFDVLVKNKAPKLQTLEGKPTADDRAHLFDTISQMHKAIQAGVALPAPDGAWWCSQKWCGFANVCPKFKGKK